MLGTLQETHSSTKGECVGFSIEVQFYVRNAAIVTTYTLLYVTEILYTDRRPCQPSSTWHWECTALAVKMLLYI